MSTKLKVGVKEASELMADGYEVECYLILPPAGVKPKKRKVRPTVPQSRVALAVNPRKEPTLGAIALTWIKVRENFFSNDPTKYATRKRLEDWAIKHGGNKNQVSQFIHAYQCVRVLDEADDKKT